MTKAITIIGGGASGTLVAINLMRLAGSQQLTINLVEKQGEVGRGVAYSTRSDVHRLNVPAGKMGAFPDAPDHFHKWLLANQHPYSPDDFVPRRLYAEYLQSLLQEAIGQAPNVAFNLFQDEAIDLNLEDDRALVQLKSGTAILADRVVLAFGNFLPPRPAFVSNEAASHPKYFSDPWDARIFLRINPADKVLVMGMGLTAVDTVLSLHANRHAGPIHAISTHGWWPAVHQLGFSYPDFSVELAGKTSLAHVLAVVRGHLRQAEAAGSNWRAVIDSLRPATQTLWQALPLAEQRRFMRHLRRLWDVTRHRLPQECAAVLDELQTNGQLHALRGRIHNVTVAQGMFEVTYGEASTLSVDAIINCIGSQADFTQVDLPLVQSLLHKGYAQPDALRLGLDAQPDGKISERLCTLGTALKGVLWESTAMPEIRVQAQQLAGHLLEE